MSRGSRIVVTAEPRGQFVQGYIGAGLTPKPGTVVQVQAATALKGGRETWELYAGDADGGRPKGPYIVLIENYPIGASADTAYAAGDFAFGYIPQEGDELNLLVANLAGTADDHTKGEMLIVDTGTGKMIATTGSPENEVAQLKETITDPTADTLSWCVWTGA